MQTWHIWKEEGCGEKNLFFPALYGILSTSLLMQDM